MYVKHKIKCPRHFVLKPGKTGFIMERDPLLKNFTEETCKRFGISVWKKKKDKYGRPIRNDRDFYQPDISGAKAIEHVWDPMNPICIACKNRCWEGRGRPNSIGINRLHGKGHKNQDLKSRGVVGL